MERNARMSDVNGNERRTGKKHVREAKKEDVERPANCIDQQIAHRLYRRQKVRRPELYRKKVFRYSTLSCTLSGVNRIHA